MKIKPFIAVRPPREIADQVASPPYDVVDTEEARKIAEGNPHCFLRIVRSEIELPEDTPAYDDAIYQAAASNFERFKQEGWLKPTSEPAVYVYRLQQETHAQVGLVTVCHIDDYDAGRIKRHEKTRKLTEDDRTRHVDTVNANTGPVFLTYRDHPVIDRLVEETQNEEPLYDFEASDKVRHTVWEVREADPWVTAFAEIKNSYVADGHHRAASAARVARLRRDADPHSTGEEEYNWFLSVLFPAGQLRILPYNRCVKDLNGMDASAFLKEVRNRFSVTEADKSEPVEPGGVCMYLDRKWYLLSWEEIPSDDPVSTLDVSVLQDRLLHPLLGIDDPRDNPRIEFVGGVRGTKELEKRVNSGRAAVAFSMYPVSVDQLLAVADAGRIMPPKSTWFEPKLKSGLLVHELGPKR